MPDFKNDCLIHKHLSIFFYYLHFFRLKLYKYTNFLLMAIKNQKFLSNLIFHYKSAT